ncbi:unnamed protein product [Gongylonema pulchrum]|uniref:EB domain-containing protein n=1 Tax=Gongylonema pulchrum TaxID=637853 RepID=A0A183E9J9_9BILA|nr:unnamed protein product [Gongylonema pulchrum]
MNQVAVGGRCYALARMGEPCAYTQQCVDKLYPSLQCLNGYCIIQMNDNPRPVCKDPNAKVEYMNDSITVKNCLYWPCTVGYFCEYNPFYNNGQYICCGSNSNDIYGQGVIRVMLVSLVLYVYIRGQ